MNMKAETSDITGAETQVSPPPPSIANTAQLWEAAVYYQTQGNSDVSAMQLIWQALVPAIGYQQLANVIAAVYAKTYWATTSMTPATLANNMVAALGLSPNLATSYASNAMLTWEGAFSRANLGDNGLIPKQGELSSSCDIVVNAGTSLTTNFLISQWNNAFLNAPSTGKNYIYLRGQNLGFNYDLTVGGSTPVTVNMFYTTAGFNQPPTSWVQLSTVSNNSTSGVVNTIEPGPITLGTKFVSEAFMFDPASDNHVCLIGVINSNFFTSNPVLSSQSNWNSSTWLASNGAAAWQNVNPSAGTQTSLAFYNQDGTSETFAFKAFCRNFPVGASVRLSANHNNVSFDSGSIEIFHSSQTFEHEFKLPGNYKGYLLVSMLDKQGNPLPSSAVLKLQMAWRVKRGNSQYMRALQHFGSRDSAIAGDDLDINVGEYMLISSGEK